MYYYAISTFRTSRTAHSNELMLYRFKTRRARTAFVAARAQDRAGIPRDLVRMIFPKFRYHSQDGDWWVHCEIPNPERHADGTRAARVPCDYFYDVDAGKIATAPFELVADVRADRL